MPTENPPPSDHDELLKTIQELEQTQATLAAISQALNDYLKHPAPHENVSPSADAPEQAG